MKRNLTQALLTGDTNSTAAPPAAAPVKRRKKSGPELIVDGVTLEEFASSPSSPASTRSGSRNPQTAVATNGRDAGSTSFEGVSWAVRELLEAIEQADPTATGLLQRINNAKDRRIGDTGNDGKNGKAGKKGKKPVSHPQSESIVLILALTYNRLTRPW